jgi:hypothetical protein
MTKGWEWGTSGITPAQVPDFKPQYHNNKKRKKKFKLQMRANFVHMKSDFGASSHSTDKKHYSSLGNYHF